MPRHRKHKKHHSQKIYKMKGCNKSRKNRKTITRRRQRKYLGGGSGGTCGLSQPATPPSNTNGVNPYDPSTGPQSTGYNFLNSQIMRGGSCSSCNAPQPLMSGGGSDANLPTLIGAPWAPGTGIPSEYTNNHFALNQYANGDPQLAMKNVGAQPPFLGGGGSRRRRMTRIKKSRKGQRGGILANFLGQDFVNLGRQIGHSFDNVSNGIKGVHQSSNPMPWSDQLKSTVPDIATLKKTM